MRCLTALLLCATTLASGANTPFVFPRSTPEAQGVPSAALLRFVEDAEQELDALHSFMLVRHGRVVAEGWWAPYAAGEPHMMFSLSKSFTSTAVGLAVAEGRLAIDDPILKFFPDLAPAEPGANLKAMRVRDLLTMTAGHHEEDIRSFPYGGEADPAEAFLALPVSHKPGTLFVYNTPASYMLSAIVQQVTGETVLDYLRPRLFEPLGIENPAWQANRHGVSMGGFGLSIRTEDIARFGQLYLQKGAWQGRQLVPAEWVEAAAARQVSNGSSPESDWEQGYGYQFWRSRHGFYRGDGAHGQFCLVLPQHDAVVAITSGTRDMGSVMNLVWDRLVPSLREAPLPEDPAAHRRLTAKLSALSLPTVRGERPATASEWVGRRYVFDDAVARQAPPSVLTAPDEAIESVVLDRADPDGSAAFTIRMNGGDHAVTAKAGGWARGTLRLGEAAQPVAASGGWTAPDTYTLELVLYRTPFRNTYRFRFAGDELSVRRERNVGAPEGRVLEITGRSKAPATASRGAAAVPR